MSYGICLKAKIDGTDKYVTVAEPECCSPTYNLRKIFVKSMGWDYEHGLYPCSDVLEYIHRGLSELTINGSEYRKLEPPNGWETVETAIETLTCVQKCILETSKKIPIEHIFFSWKGDNIMIQKMM